MKELDEFKSENLKKLGKRIKELRKAKGFKNNDMFAFTHGISRSQYNRYENGEDLRFSTLLKLIHIHEMTLDEFFQAGFEWFIR